MPTLGDPIKFRDERQRQALGRECVSLITELEAQHHTMFRRFDVYRDWRNGTPDVRVRTKPWHGASNLVIPFAGIQVDGFVARVLFQLFSTPSLWNGDTQNEAFQDLVAPWMQFLNRGARRGLGTNMFYTIESWADEQQELGRSVVRQVWDTRQRFIMPPKGKKPVLMNLGSGPRLDHFQREQVLSQPDVPIHESEIVAVQSLMTRNMLQRMALNGGWDKDVTARVLAHSGVQGVMGQLRQERNKRMGITEEMDARLQPHDIREVWIDFPLLRGMDQQESVDGITHFNKQPIEHISVPIVVYLHMNTAEVLDARYSQYILPDLPFYEIHRKKRNGRGESSTGLPKDLEHIQRGMSTRFNQAIDRQTLDNALHVFTTDRRLADRGYDPNTINLVNDIGAIKVERAGSNIVPDLTMINALKGFGELIGGQSDPFFGKETRMGGHPSPATNTLVFQQNMQILSTRSLKSIRMELTRIAEHRTILYQQFEQNRGRHIHNTFGDEDAEKIMQVLEAEDSFVGNVTIDVHPMSEVHNPDAEMRKAVMVDQVVTNYFVKVAKFLETSVGIAATPQERQAALAEMQEVAREAITAFGKTTRTILEVAQVDDVEEFVHKLQESASANIDLIGNSAAFLGSTLGAGRGEGEERIPRGAVGSLLPARRNGPGAPAAAGGSGFTG